MNKTSGGPRYNESVVTLTGGPKGPSSPGSPLNPWWTHKQHPNQIRRLKYLEAEGSSDNKNTQALVECYRLCAATRGWCSQSSVTLYFTCKQKEKITVAALSGHEAVFMILTFSPALPLSPLGPGSPVKPCSSHSKMLTACSSLHALITSS